MYGEFSTSHAQTHASQAVPPPLHEMAGTNFQKWLEQMEILIFIIAFPVFMSCNKTIELAVLRTNFSPTFLDNHLRYAQIVVFPTSPCFDQSPQDMTSLCYRLQSTCIELDKFLSSG